MRLIRLDLWNFRRFVALQFEPAPGLNLLLGDNGAGKTTILESLHLLAYGRSFRGRVRDGLVQQGSVALEVFAELETGLAGVRRRVGLRHAGSTWTGRLDASDVEQLGVLCQATAVVTFEPGSHALIAGAAEIRRRYLDWGVFHVEHDSLAPWRRYNRALRQRNALLKAGRAGSELDIWDRELVEAAAPVDAMRESYVDALNPVFASLAAELVPAVGHVGLKYAPGWRRESMNLEDALLLGRDRDLAAGFTSVGPHRADAPIRFDAFPGRDALSRGQAKLLALSLLLAQAGHQAAVTGEWPIIALDDLASELDTPHQDLVLQRLQSSGAQVLITGTQVSAAVSDRRTLVALFHVEHGGVRHG